MRSKCGHEFVEAAIVLPVLILTILSLILLIIFFFSCLQEQAAIHEEMLSYAAKSDKLFQIYRENAETSKQSRGIVNSMLHKEIVSRIYVINEADLIRAGDFLDFGQP